ncbi:hypothetical protein N781_08725 [Pontibacillus halophilus JSM 076056 = DSM 19796]|uniref:Lipid II:glycine glycyltransferase n=1 Tax=Pontibacillus halophilus JSM 076056 = DSM 19796 TaxID=1385510 RepID=A0A0A5G9Z5_9BACI|nr:hypothetical protein N781_08725 [Pontibacillus halophilus JSM 076056 = DSM 19796]
MLFSVDVSEKKRWDEIVKSFDYYDVNYLNGYVSAFSQIGEGKPKLIYYDDGETKGINVVLIRDIAYSKPFLNKIPTNTYFDLVTPYGYGGFLIEGENINALKEAYKHFCTKNGVVSEFTRYHLLHNKYKEFFDDIKTYKKNVVRDLNLSLDDMFMDFEHKVRKSIKKAWRSQLEIEVDYTGDRLDDFLLIYYDTMDRAKADENYYFSKEFFQYINEYLKDHFVYFHVLYDGKIISSELVLYGKDNCYSFLGGTDRRYMKLSANNFLKYEIIKWAKGIGLSNFILGGGYGSEDGIFKYKKGFSPNGMYDFYVGKHIYDQEKYQYLVNLRKSELDFEANSEFFPIYRAGQT